MSNIEIVIQPKVSDLGDNFFVRRSLPNIEKKMVGPFIFWDHMGPVELEGDKTMVVRAHPHIGLSTITWLFSGEIMHRDSLGNEQMIKPGEVNWMTAGRGIAHSERASSAGSPLMLEGIQLWLALPKEYEDIEPNFFHCKENELPLKFDQDSKLILIAGSACGMKSPVPVYSDLFYLNGDFKKDFVFDMPLPGNHEGAVYVVEGEIDVESACFERFSLVVFRKGTGLSFKVNKDSKVLIFGGAVFPERRYIWWNFVSSDREKIENAKKDWKAGRFSKVINESEVIPLPSE
ncbi:MAG: pirin family protein [Bdellovibrionota bacterium]